MIGRAWPLIVVAVVAFGIGAWFTLGTRSEPRPEPVSRGYVLDEPRALPDFTLVDDTGDEFTQAGFQGHWSVLYFGFTFCPDICPNSLAVMAQIKQQLAEAGALDDRYYLVSVDPARDTPQRLAEYVTYFDPDFRGLTGDFDQLDLLTRAAGAVYRVPDDPVDENYLVAHSSTLTVIDPQGRIHALFTSPFDPQAIAARLRAAIDDFDQDS